MFQQRGGEISALLRPHLEETRDCGARVSSQLGVYGGQACARVLIGWQTSLTISGDAAAPQAHAFPCTESAQRAIDNEKKISKKKKMGGSKLPES